MTASFSLVPYSRQKFVLFPMGGKPTADAPTACLSLLSSGDMWGDGRAARNRTSLFVALGIEEERVRTLRQVHSKRVVSAEELASPGIDSREVEADGLLTGDPRLVLGVRVADCFPILLFDPATKSFAALHSGWRGTGIVTEAVAQMSLRYGARPADIVALVGPGIGVCCYNVPPERAELFRERFGAETVQERGGMHFLDLAAANRRLLEQAGVKEITVISDCTSCSPFLGSFRRQGPELFTHMLALIGYFG